MVEKNSQQSESKNLNNEHVIIEKILAGDSQASNQLIQHYYPKIKSFIYFRPGNYFDDIEGLTNEILLAVLQNLHKFDYTRGSLSAFVYAITRNKILASLKKQENRKLIDTLDFPDLDEFESTSQNIQSLENKDLIKKALKKLPVKSKEILYLRYYKEMEISEIKDVLKLSSNYQVHNRLHYAMSQLRKEIKLLEKGGE